MDFPQDLQKAIIDLSINLLPWKPETMFQPKDNKPLRVKELKALVESLSNEDRRARPSDLRGSEKPSLEQLQSIVAHFQKLFDVTSVSGVFPRMNELYMRVGEVYNAMHTIRELLNLGEFLARYISCFMPTPLLIGTPLPSNTYTSS